MAVRFANSYVDRLFAERDFVSIHHLISVVGRDRSLPEEFWLFCRVFEWAPSRSGVWQYYEGLPDPEFERISQALDRFGLAEIAEKYRVGKRTWDGPDKAADLDEWLETNAREIHAAVFDLIAPRKDCLRDES
jgi:hypothetical protein